MINVLFFQKHIFTWYQKYARHVLWRQTRDPYTIVVSEIMLQQTQVDRVNQHLPRWLKRFPTWHHLAHARQRSVLREWSGMGYNRRALSLHRLAKVMVRDYHEKLPRTLSALESLPGIGLYTARALRAFVWNEPQATVDVNIYRLIHRFFIGVEIPQTPKTSQQLFIMAQKIYPTKKHNHKLWNHALMDFGALVCTARNPKCHMCPLATRCRAQPTIHTQQPISLRLRTKYVEPCKMEKGKCIPNRIFRGRIIEYLRHHGSVTINDLGVHIKSDFSRYDRPWLIQLLSKLSHDTLITITNFRITLR